MRVSRQRAELNRRNVVEVAGRLFRERGYDGIGVSDLMKNADLTHGAFYKQFGSKADLVREASADALRLSAERWDSLIESDQNDPFAALVGFYLSEFHRVETQDGCVLAALAPEAPRHGTALRETFEEGVERHLAQLEQLAAASSDKDRRSNSMVVLSTMLGALILARAVRAPELSGDILKAAATSLLDQRSVDDNKRRDGSDIECR